MCTNTTGTAGRIDRKRRNLLGAIAGVLLLAQALVMVGCAKPGQAATAPTTEPMPTMYFPEHLGPHKQIIFVIEASGSMAVVPKSWPASIFNTVVAKMTKSIARLHEEAQDFHVIFFSARGIVEGPSKQLAPASPDRKKDTVAMMKKIIPGGGAPELTPAMTRAFDVLDRAGESRNSKDIFLLTDGALGDSATVLKAIRERNKNGRVQIYVFLFGEAKDDSAVKLMKAIAKENGGTFRHVEEPD